MDDDYLPAVSHNIPRGFRGGRSVHDGYQRGIGLESGKLVQAISADADFVEAVKYAEDRSLIWRPRALNLFLLMKFYLPRLPFGHIIEFGSYRGGSAFFMAALAERFLPGAQVFALDTFEGMPQTDKTVDAHNQGDFATADFEEILATQSRLNLTNLHFVKGLFIDTAADTVQKAKPIALAHIDCDIYESVRFTYEICKTSMVPCGYIVFDDSTSSSCIGATEAVERWVIGHDGLLSEQIYPHHVFRSPPQ